MHCSMLVPGLAVQALWAVPETPQTTPYIPKQPSQSTPPQGPPENYLMIYGEPLQIFTFRTFCQLTGTLKGI